MFTQTKLVGEARRLAKLLAELDRKIVFAESCTGGLVSATLAGIPGISLYHCGSAVVYRLATKANWLQIPEKLLKKPGPVSEMVAREMSRRVLQRTPEAHVAASVTGHLGPGVPRELDGLAYVAVSVRELPSTRQRCATTVATVHLHPAGRATSPESLRRLRQREAAWHVLVEARSVLERQAAKLKG